MSLPNKGGSPVPVQVANEEPLVVEVAEPATPTPIKTASGMSLPPTTTEQQDMVTAGQRRVNILWEITQSTIAVSITMAIIYTAISEIDSQVLTSAFFLIIGFYYSRVNHQAIGGVGRKANEDQAYRGR